MRAVAMPEPGDMLVARDRPRTWRRVESVEGCRVRTRKPNGTPETIPASRLDRWEVVRVERMFDDEELQG